MDYFSVIGIENKYNIDKEDLERKYLDLQKKYHPDQNYKSSNDDDSHDYIYKALEISNAYNIISDDLRRAVYLLKLNQFDIENSDSSIEVDQDLLNEIFMQREYVENLNDQSLLKDSLDETNQKIRTIIENLSELFISKNYLQALKVTVRLKYLDILKKIIIKKLE
jgi:molecular chaperone HscB